MELECVFSLRLMPVFPGIRSLVDVVVVAVIIVSVVAVTVCVAISSRFLFLSPFLPRMEFECKFFSSSISPSHDSLPSLGFQLHEASGRIYGRDFQASKLNPL